MRSKVAGLVAAVCLVLCARAQAGTVAADIRDQNGKPIANAVITLIADAKSDVLATTHLPFDKIIDQRDETFIPLVTIVPRGGRVVFANNDPTMHQVYSFSAIRQFEFTLAHGQKSAAVQFDKAGVAAIGCNIHDHMIAYVFVADSPWTGLTDEDGRVRLTDVPAGAYMAQVWHPRLPPGAARANTPVRIGPDTTNLKVTVTVMPDPAGHRRHDGGY
jgi:plastocyanin